MPAEPKERSKIPKVQKFYRDILQHLQSGSAPDWPGPASPVCKKCDLCNRGSVNPFLPPSGSDQPLITVVLDAPSRKEDAAGGLARDGLGLYMKSALLDMGREFGVTEDHLRFVGATRCAIVEGKGNPATGGRWCRYYLHEDLRNHRPRLVMPVGSVALGLLSHKSNVQDWGGRLLTYRGWPDDWLIDSKFESGHPVYGARPGPEARLPMVPVQNPKLVYATRNPRAIAKWREQMRRAIKLATDGVVPPVYDKPWWRLTEDPHEVVAACQQLIEHPGTVLTYDTETTGLKPFLGKKIVFMMFRWDDPVTGQPRALGWPWDYRKSDKPAESMAESDFEESALLPYLNDLAPWVLEALAASRLRGHNLTFDLLFTIGSVPGGLTYLDRLCEAFHEDTWHMRYCLRQERGSMGLEVLAYDWAPHLAGYEEEFSLLMERLPYVLKPDYGGHYANCPRSIWDHTFRPYVMGDVEVCAEAAVSLRAKMHELDGYEIPLAHPTARGQFRRYKTLNREQVYDKVLRPAGSLLAKLAARGMYVSPEELASQEVLYPKMVADARREVRVSSPDLERWCQAQEASDPEWHFDLGNSSILKTSLFQVMGLPVTTLTKAGLKLFRGRELSSMTFEEKLKYASTDKFTINSLAVRHPEIRPLLKYRSLHKQYTSYIRPLRNITTPGIDKRAVDRDPLLMLDHCVHADFKLAATRTGRLACSNPNLQQLPRDGMIKKLFSSRFGERGCIYQADLSQIELRLLAAACGDPTMVQAYWDKTDLHSLTTSLVFGIPYEQFTEQHELELQRAGRADEVKKLKGKRKIGKTLNFLTGYGGGGLGFQTALALQGVYIELEECERHLENFFNTYPYLRTHIGYYKKFIMEHGRAVSILGRVRILDEVYSENNSDVNKALRAGYNHLIQSTAADMMLLCLAAIEILMREASLESQLMTTVHDSLGIDAVKDEVPQIHEIVEPVLSNIPEVLELMLGPNFDTSWCIVPFSGDCAVGKTYYDETKIPAGAASSVDWDRVFQTAGLA